QLLINNRNARFLCFTNVGKSAFGPLQHDLTAILGMRIHAGERFYQRGLAGAILAHQRMNLSGLKIETDTIESTNAWEGLRDLFHFEKRAARSFEFRVS